MNLRRLGLFPVLTILGWVCIALPASASLFDKLKEEAVLQTINSAIDKNKKKFEDEELMDAEDEELMDAEFEAPNNQSKSTSYPDDNIPESVHRFMIEESINPSKCLGIYKYRNEVLLPDTGGLQRTWDYGDYFSYYDKDDLTSETLNSLRGAYGSPPLDDDKRSSFHIELIQAVKFTKVGTAYKKCNSVVDRIKQVNQREKEQIDKAKKESFGW